MVKVIEETFSNIYTLNIWLGKQSSEMTTEIINIQYDSKMQTYRVFLAVGKANKTGG